MKIVIAKTAGFCMGVRRAVDMVLDASTRYQEPIFTYGPLIHNPQVIQMLEEKKIFRLNSIPEKGHGIVLIRAHGVPPEDRDALKKAGFTVINATCPRVVRVQAIINRYAKKEYSTIIVGDKNHPEVVGLLGYAKGKGHTVSSMEDFLLLPGFENAVVVAQTTQNMSLYGEIKAWCEVHAPHYKVFETICGSTEKRQTEIRKLAAENDAVVVVGGKDSGNTRRLAEIAVETGKPAIHIEDASEIDYEILSNAKSIALTAGASTPNWIITDTYRKIEDHLQKRHAVKAVLYFFRDFLLKTNIMASMGAGSLTFACSMLQGNAKTLRHAGIAMLYVLSMQILNNLFAIRSDRYNHPKRALFYKENRVSLWFLAVLSGGAGLFLSYLSGPLPFILLLIMSVLGLSYNLKLFPATVKTAKITSIKDIPGSKTILIVLAWGTVTCLLPAITHHKNYLSVAVVFLFATGLVFARTAFFDILAIQGDRITGKETLPILLGEKKSFNIIKYTLLCEAGLLFFSNWAYLLIKNSFLLAIVPFCMFLLIRFFEKDRLVSGEHREFIIESLLIATGLLSAVI